ncbi:hypothetical protein MKW98_031297 [Papaver atlanticum]|uniref:RING-type E3 ubiquitin transferase n=1 Tax=Papaver atlanticum TaxID=357466 RepID=A0AAD4X8B6_9MAGN|nr:hypothetical protein MKW98_031297 [Papaver atlanticum]
MKPQKDFRFNNNIVISNCKYDEDVCRICRNPGDSENPLKCPCACSGSIKFVHQDCLLQWLNYSNARQCEICRYPFSFSPVYAENARDEDLVPSDDLVSMQLVLSCNMKIVGAVIFLPFSIGRIILHIVSYCVGKPLADSSSRLSDVTIIATGYLFTVSVVLFYIGIFAMVSYVKGEALIVGRLYVVTYIADSVISHVRQYMTIMRRLMSMVGLHFFS